MLMLSYLDTILKFTLIYNSILSLTLALLHSYSHLPISLSYLHSFTITLFHSHTYTHSHALFHSHSHLPSFTPSLTHSYSPIPLTDIHLFTLTPIHTHLYSPYFTHLYTQSHPHSPSTADLRHQGEARAEGGLASPEWRRILPSTAFPALREGTGPPLATLLNGLIKGGKLHFNHHRY